MDTRGINFNILGRRAPLNINERVPWQQMAGYF